jgi:hypothetical protein
MPFLRRLTGAMMLDPDTYEDVESHPAAGLQATLTVIGSSICAGLGAMGFFQPDIQTMLAMTLLALVTWLAWAMLALQIGTRWFATRDTKADFGQMVRALGFAAAPGFFQIFAAMPRVTVPVFVGTALWMLAAMVVAVRQALDFTSTARAIAVCLVALAVAGGLSIFVAAAFSKTLQ